MRWDFVPKDVVEHALLGSVGDLSELRALEIFSAWSIGYYLALVHA